MKISVHMYLIEKKTFPKFWPRSMHGSRDTQVFCSVTHRLWFPGAKYKKWIFSGNNKPFLSCFFLNSCIFYSLSHETHYNPCCGQFLSKNWKMCFLGRRPPTEHIENPTSPKFSKNSGNHVWVMYNTWLKFLVSIICCFGYNPTQKYAFFSFRRILKNHIF